MGAKAPGKAGGVCGARGPAKRGMVGGEITINGFLGMVLSRGMVKVGLIFKIFQVPPFRNTFPST